MKIGMGAEGVGEDVAADEGDTSVEAEVLRSYEQLKKESDGDEADETVDSNVSDEHPVVKAKEEGEAPTKEAGNTSAVEESKPRRGRPPKSVGGGAPTSESEFIAPPNDWEGEAKESFLALDPTAKKQIKRISDAFQSYRQKEIEIINSTKREWEGNRESIKEPLAVVQRFLTKWGVEKKTPEIALTELCTFNDLCIKDKYAGVKALAQKLGVKVTIHDQPETKSADNNQPMDYTTLKNTVKEELRAEELANSQATIRQNLANAFDNALGTLRDEISEGGKYIRPDLHNPEFERQLGPLVVGIKRANPSLSESECITRAYIANGGRVLPQNSPITAKPNGSVRNPISAAKAANGSVAGSNGGNFDNDELEVIAGETVEQTVARAHARIFSR